MHKGGTESGQQQAEIDRLAFLNAEIAAFAFCKMSHNEIANHRRRPGSLPDGGGAIQSSTLRYSDEQTVTALVALQRAIEKQDAADPRHSDDWGLVASSRFLGRVHLNLAFKRFRSEGVWGVSPHMIPHYALHAPAGTLSLALGIHGPSLGIGGAHFAATDGLLTALTWLANGFVPGVWFVTSGWSPELQPEGRDRPSKESECQALALGLVSASSPTSGRPRLRMVVSEQPAMPRPINLTELANRLSGDRIEPGIMATSSSRIDFHRPHSATAIPRPHFDLAMHPRLSSRTIGTDAVGHVRVELLTAQSGSVREEEL